MNQNLNQLYNEISECSRCLLNTHRTFGWGNEDSSILFLGLNPHVLHNKESKSIFCFDLNDEKDRKSGFIIKSALKNIDADISNFFWYNLVCCAHESGKPTEEMFSNCYDHFLSLLKNLKNLKTIICLGNEVYSRLNSSALDLIHEYKIVKVKHPAYYLHKGLNSNELSSELQVILNNKIYS